MNYEQATRDELREELKRRHLPVSGNKDELIERLEKAEGGRGGGDGQAGGEGDRDGAQGGGSDQGSDRSDGSDRSGDTRRKLKPMQLARLAGAQLMQLTGRDLDGTSGIERTDEGWRVLLEVVEVTRVPRAMDVLGLYEVIVDDDGDLVRYERLRRYGRTQPESSE